MIVFCVLCALLLAGLTLLAIAGYVELAVIIFIACWVFMAGVITGSLLED